MCQCATNLCPGMEQGGPVQFGGAGAHSNVVKGDAGIGVLLELGLVLHEVHLAAHAAQGVEASTLAALASLCITLTAQSTATPVGLHVMIVSRYV